MIIWYSIYLIATVGIARKMLSLLIFIAIIVGSKQYFLHFISISTFFCCWPYISLISSGLIVINYSCVPMGLIVTLEYLIGDLLVMNNCDLNTKFKLAYFSKLQIIPTYKLSFSKMAYFDFKQDALNRYWSILYCLTFLNKSGISLLLLVIWIYTLFVLSFNLSGEFSKSFKKGITLLFEAPVEFWVEPLWFCIRREACAVAHFWIYLSVGSCYRIISCVWSMLAIDCAFLKGVFCDLPELNSSKIFS